MPLILRPGYTDCVVPLGSHLAQVGTMSGFRTILVATALSMSLSGCITAGVMLASTAMSLVSGGGAQPSGRGMRNPIDKPMTGREIRESLSRMNDKVDPACQQIMDERQQSQSGGQTPMPAKASDSTDNTTEYGPPAKAPGNESPDGAAQQASAAADHGPGVCRHQLVCLPGTPKPTLMLMCGGGKQQVKTSSEAGVAVIDPSVGAADTNDVGPVIVPAKPTGGAADWNWEQDPSKQL